VLEIADRSFKHWGTVCFLGEPQRHPIGIVSISFMRS
jgi:hypothetical protein